MIKKLYSQLQVRALFGFSPPTDPENKNMLPFREGDKLAVFDKSGETAGWWKAFDGRKIGYIPRDYVTPIQIS